MKRLIKVGIVLGMAVPAVFVHIGAASAFASWGPWNTSCSTKPYLHLNSKTTGNVVHEFTVPSGFNRQNWSNGNSWTARTSYIDWSFASPGYMKTDQFAQYFTATCHN
jgi:hypothetical protein